MIYQLLIKTCKNIIRLLSKLSLTTFITDGIPKPIIRATRVDKAIEFLNYRPEYKVSDGLNEAIDWYIDSLK